MTHAERQVKDSGVYQLLCRCFCAAWAMAAVLLVGCADVPGRNEGQAQTSLTRQDKGTLDAPPVARGTFHYDPHIRLCQCPGGGCQPAGAMCSRPPMVWPNAGDGPNLPFGQGAYLEPGRTEHVAEYRLRVDDLLEFVFRRTRTETMQAYKLSVGDRIRFEMRGQADFTRELQVQPDGTISLPFLGSVRVTRRTLDELRTDLGKKYAERIEAPEITITPLQVNTVLQDLLDSVDRRYGQGGLAQDVRVTPDGAISLPAVGPIQVQGLTLKELELELFHRFAAIVEGLEVTPVLRARAPRFVYVLGEVAHPGRFTLEGPTTVMQAIALSGGVTTAAASKLRHVAVFRRGPDWQLMATKIDVRGPVIGGHVNIHSIDELWLADSDIVLVPKSEILVLDEHLELFFTRGIYSAVPFQSSLSFLGN